MVIVQTTKIVVVIGSILHEEEQIIRNLVFFRKTFQLFFSFHTRWNCILKVQTTTVGLVVVSVYNGGHRERLGQTNFHIVQPTLDTAKPRR